MTNAIRLETPISDGAVLGLRAGDNVLLSGIIYTGRDAAHRRMTELAESGSPLPFDPIGTAIYYAGPCPAPPGRIIGSIGPTTSTRMDAYAPALIRLGLKVMIGKGSRSREVANAIRERGGLYLAAIGGAGALYSRCVAGAEVIAYEDLGTEAIRRLTVADMPLIVAIDSTGAGAYAEPNLSGGWR